ncbi:MAG TPA: hypothetical protein VNC50_15325 [Planctomycetia bacterium]|nr:hypothetical protein [Planctomycetia bacterium]
MFVVGKDLCQPPIHDLYFAELAHHDVRRLQVSVDHSLAVSVADRLRHLQECGDVTGAIHRPIGKVVGESLASDELHCQERTAVRQNAYFVNGGYAGMLELARHLAFFDETRNGFSVAAVPVLKDLDGDLSIHRGVVGAIHDPHAAAADLAEQFKLGDDGGGGGGNCLLGAVEFAG